MNQAQRIIVSVALVVALIGVFGRAYMELGGGDFFNFNWAYDSFLETLTWNLDRLAITAGIPLLFIWKTKEGDE